jgi:glycosyltransferase involved in cell wall biosynthesis
MNIVVVNYAYDQALADPDELLSRYHSLTGWCEALFAAGASRVTAVQRFSTVCSRSRGGVDYHFCDDRLFGLSRLPLRTGSCLRLVRGSDPDIVHVNGLEFSVETNLLRRGLRPETALVVQDHASGDPVPPRSLIHAARRSLRRRLMREVDGFLFTSTAQAEGWQRSGLIAGNQPVYAVLEASTSITSVDRVEARKRTGIEGNPALLWIGRLNANKDPMTVLNGFEQSLAQVPSATLSMIYSEGDLLAAVRDRLNGSPALAARVRLIGRVPHDRISSFCSAADVFVVGSHHEGSGYAVMEACACGLSPVVSDIPAFRSITNGGAIGSLWPSGNPSALAEGIVRVAQIDRQAARARVLAHFDEALSWSAVAQAAMRAYRDAVARRRGKTA